MRILYVSQYFPPEMGAPAARVHELSRAWVRLGHEVTVVTGFPQHPEGVLQPADRGVVTRREVIDGIDVIRCWSYAAANAGTTRRMIGFASFMASASIIGSFRAGSVVRPDVVIATVPQLLCGCAGSFLARRFSAPFVLEVRDLWPESVLAVGAMRDNVVVAGLRRTAQLLYDSADHMVAVGDGYRREMQRLYNVPPARVSVIPNGIDTALFTPRPPSAELRAELGWTDRFVALYVGTIGMAHGLDLLLAAARRLATEAPDVLLALVGAGSQAESLADEVKRAGVTNVQFIGKQPRERIPDLYAACDIGVITLRDSPLFRTVLPSKMFEYAAMQRPVVLSVAGDAAELLQRANGGICVAPGNADELADGILSLRADAGGRAAMGASARHYVLANHDRDELAREYVELLQGLVP